ncbi:MAG: hypothetical protein OXU66_05480 [Gammaproteobacteria bacterium]|nr:hypothetical protein [Gammaproteobacteria bacterium]
MKRLLQYSLGALLLISGWHIQAAEDCSADGNVQFLCGPVSPEDLAQIPDSPWVIASGMEDDGYLYFTHSDELSSIAVYPSPTAAHDLHSLYADCPGPLSTGFRPHGVNLIPGDNGIHTLLVVRHGDRESIEIFEIEETAGTPGISWIGCVMAPEGIVFNSVVATPEQGMAATHMNLPLGAVYEWQPGGDWEQVPGSVSAGPNGIEISPDGNWFYIGGWGTRSIIKLSRGQSNVEVESVDLPHHVDNVRWATDGSLLAAGHVGPEANSIIACLSQQQCAGVSSHVTRIDVNNLTAREIIDYPSNPMFLLGTVAIEVGDEVWVGGIAGSNRIARFEYR